MNVVYAILIGFVLDLLLGDPAWMQHPVVWMGKGIAWLEGVLRKRFLATQKGERRAGRVLAAVLPLASFWVSYGVLFLLGLIHPIVRLAAESWMCYQILACRELWRQSMLVYKALKNAGIEAARNAVARIVGRDTVALDIAGVIKAAVETIAENTSDAVIAPLVFMAIGGAPLGMCYKAINTMDSMVGYKNNQYLNFGRAAALLDDVVNYVPARFSGLCMVVGAPIAGLSVKGAWRIWRRDARNHASPNSAQTEAAAAGALGVQLAGDAVYFGKQVQKPYIGDAGRPVEIEDIPRANRLMLIASVLAVCLCCGARAVLFLLL